MIGMTMIILLVEQYSVEVLDNGKLSGSFTTKVRNSPTCFVVLVFIIHVREIKLVYQFSMAFLKNPIKVIPLILIPIDMGLSCSLPSIYPIQSEARSTAQRKNCRGAVPAGTSSSLPSMIQYLPPSSGCGPTTRVIIDPLVTWATKNPLTFHYTGCLIGIPTMVWYNPHITG